MTYPYTPRYFWRFHIHSPEMSPQCVAFDEATRVWSRADALAKVNAWNAQHPTTNCKYWIGADETRRDS